MGVDWKRHRTAPLATLYLDKPMKGHTLMQAIARVNRVTGGKKHGLIIDYNGMLKSLRKALATFAQGDRSGKGEGFEIISANTDGITIDAKDRTKNAIEIGNKWIQKTGHNLEHTEYKQYVSVSVNDYFAVTPEGEVKAKGWFPAGPYRQLLKKLHSISRVWGARRNCRSSKNRTT